MILSMAQMSMDEDIWKNKKKTLEYCKKAKGSDLLFFPEIQFSPFFPQFKNGNANHFLMKQDEEILENIQKICGEQKMYISPNMYMEIQGKRYDASVWIDKEGKLVDIAKMVHIANGENFYEQDYYEPSDDGFKVFDTEFGKVGIVICYDRHFPDSIQISKAMGASLIIIPTANCKAEPMDYFAQEICDLARQNSVSIAMCNRVGKEKNMEFAGESLVVNSRGEIVLKADDREQLITCELMLEG